MRDMVREADEIRTETRDLSETRSVRSVCRAGSTIVGDGPDGGGADGEVAQVGREEFALESDGEGGLWGGEVEFVLAVEEGGGFEVDAAGGEEEGGDVVFGWEVGVYAVADVFAGFFGDGGAVIGVVVSLPVDDPWTDYGHFGDIEAELEG